MSWPPSPHPLDFDWRYDELTAHALTLMLIDSGPVVAIGAPTVARMLERASVDVTLVDRQPEQGLVQQIACDVSEFAPDRLYRTALVDPPWYPAQLMSWPRVAARAVGLGGTVLVSIWPIETRPTALSELSTLFADFSTWADVRRGAGLIRYDMPHFEAVARRHGNSGKLSRSPLIGELVRLRITHVPAIPPFSESACTWRRFTVDDYQLAIRCRRGDGRRSIEQISTAHGWLWPFVSGRAPGLERVDLWSSEGEVAALGSPDHVIETLRRALFSPDGQAFERALAEAPALLEWRIPRPPYWRSIEWLHRQ